MTTPAQGKKADSKEKKESGISSAKKRILQSKKRKLRNGSACSEIQNLLQKVKTNSKDNKTVLINKIFSLVDKGSKKGIIKANRANRLKRQASKAFVSTSSQG